MTGMADAEPPQGPRLVTDEVLSLVGTEVTYRAPEPLGAASIRHYALAIGADPDHHRHEAPPTLVCETTQLTGHRHPDENGYLGHTWDLPFPVPTTMIRGGNDYTFHQPVRVDLQASACPIRTHPAGKTAHARTLVRGGDADVFKLGPNGGRLGCSARPRVDDRRLYGYTWQ